MILDRTWNKKEQKFTISYIDKNGNRQFYQKYLHHIKTYEYDEDGEFETWNGRRCKKIFKDTTTYTPNEFDLLEFMYELPKELNDELLLSSIQKLYREKDAYIEAMKHSSQQDSINTILGLIQEASK